MPLLAQQRERVAREPRLEHLVRVRVRVRGRVTLTPDQADHLVEGRLALALVRLDEGVEVVVHYLAHVLRGLLRIGFRVRVRVRVMEP